MSRPPTYAKKVDASHADIVDALRRVGCSVTAIQSSTAGVPDLLVGLCGRTHLVECKPMKLKRDGTQSRDGKPRASQVAWAEAWRGGAIHVVHSAEEAVELANLLRMGNGLRVV